ncbi:MAG: hypothetical protein GY705_19080 [Bacteroidetes bacterium]|nr:hypothetical protein [Bacteroidota bacterium]
MKIGIMGLGIGIPETKIEVGALNMAKLYFRQNLNDAKLTKLDVRDLISFGGKSGTFLFGALETEWFELDPTKDNWAHNTNSLIGNKIEIEVSGIVVQWGTVDIAVTFFDKYNQSKELVKQCCVEVAGGVQVSTMKVRGVVSMSKI